jgi:hypothetical protein
MAKDFDPTTPMAVLPEITLVTVEFTGKSQPIKTPCALRDEIPSKSRKANIGKKAFIENRLAHISNFVTDNYP